MISRRGLNATSIRELAKHAKAPLGSNYFPEGKQQLATEAVRYAGGAVARLLRMELDAGPVAGLRAFLALWRGIVVDSDYRAGCPVLAVSLEEPPAEEIPPALVAAAEAFEDWERLLTDALREHGVAPERAPGLAALVVAAVEGATAMCRAKRTAQPLDQVAQQLEGLIAGALGPSSAPAGNVRPVATPGTPSRRTGRKPTYIQYEGFRPARREDAPDAAP